MYYYQIYWFEIKNSFAPAESGHAINLLGHKNKYSEEEFAEICNMANLLDEEGHSLNLKTLENVLIKNFGFEIIQVTKFNTYEIEEFNESEIEYEDYELNDVYKFEPNDEDMKLLMIIDELTNQIIEN